MEEREKTPKRWQGEIRCPVHGALLGKYDVRAGIVNATFFCRACEIEYTFTIRGKNFSRKNPKN